MSTRIKLREPVVAPKNPKDSKAELQGVGAEIEVDDERLLALEESGIRFQILSSKPEVTTHVTSEPEPKGNSDPKKN